ncbi:hypothetical protein N7510_009197 [Penicillium lagena]|uniref:uncharacterized protein n=1 Tax=Penicillium lagena TaxID=94218 RepID=UPI00253FF697|nr:uncharacterized protein N7510_009197 [Penicillium lagena]KAJ5606416.1 hypothetical protein N7510_009197 [Penicillium lagena]
MRRLSQALVALLLAWGVRGEADASYQRQGSLQHNAQLNVVREVVVRVDQNGDPIDVGTNHHAAETLAAAEQRKVSKPAAIVPSVPPMSNPDSDISKPPHPAVQHDTDITARTAPIHVNKKSTPHPPPHQHPHAPAHPRPREQRQFGISYSPYKPDRSCKTQEEVNKDFDRLSHHSFIRIYGTDCDQTKTVTTAARLHHMRVFAGVYDLTDFPQSLDPIIEAATLPNGKKDWSIFHTIAIGNELINGGRSSPANVVSAVNTARSILRKQGYKGPVVTVDTFSVLLQHPELCIASDYCAANCHAFFDATQHASDAGAYVLRQMHSVSAAAGGKRTMITESGWPHAGRANGAAIPSPQNQRVAVASLRRSFAHQPEDLVLFTAFDDLWKPDNQWTFDAEKFWGIH